MSVIRRILFLPLVVIALNGSAQSGRAFLKEGDKLMAEQLFEQAIEKYGFAIRTDPKLAKAYIGRADAYGSLGRSAERAADLAQVAALLPEDPAHAIA